MKFELKAIGYWSVIRVSFIVNLIVGFIFGLFYAIFIGIFISLISNMINMSEFGMLEDGFSMAGLIIIPFMFAFGGAVFNTIMFTIVAFIYNMVGRFLGGLEVELSQVPSQPVAAKPFEPSYTPPQAPPAAKTYTPPPPPPPVQPLPPDITPPDVKTDEGNAPSKNDEGFQI